MVFTDKLGIWSTTEDGCLIGPFGNALLLHPEVTAKLLEFQVGRVGEHQPVAGRTRSGDHRARRRVRRGLRTVRAQAVGVGLAGLADDHVSRPLPAETSRKAWASTRSSLHGSPLRNGNASTTIDDELYQEAESAFGAKGLFDIAAVMGVYHTVCTMLTLFEVPAA